MATDNIEADIENITGVADANDQFVISAQKHVVSSIPKNLLNFAQKASSASTDGSAIAFSVNDSIIDVQRNGYSCREIPMSEAVWALDPSSLKLATAKSPVWYHKVGSVHFAPITDGSNAGYIYYVDYSKIDDDCDLRNAVINYASAKEFTKLATDNLPSWTSLSVPVSPSSPDFGNDLTISISSPISPESPSFTYSDASVSDIVKPLISISDMASMTESSPSYVKPSLSLSAFPSLTWTLPTKPIASVTNAESSATGGATVSFSQTAPSYIPPVMQSPDWSDVENWITTEEDSEMLTSRVQAIQAQVSEFSAKLNESQATFNKENAEYQAQLQISIQNANQAGSGDGIIMQKFSNDINSYQAEVNSIINSNSNQIAEWQQENTINIQKYGVDIQNELNSFNKDNVVYQQDIQRKMQNLQKDTQEAIQNAQSDISVNSANLNKDIQIALQNALQNFQKDIQEYASKLQKYGADINAYQQNIQKEIQDFVNTLNKNTQEYQSKLALYTSNLQKYQSEVGESTQEAAVKAQNVQRYERESDKHYKWAQMEIQQYIQNNSKMIQQTMAAQAAQQQ